MLHANGGRGKKKAEPFGLKEYFFTFPITSSLRSFYVKVKAHNVWMAIEKMNEVFPIWSGLYEDKASAGVYLYRLELKRTLVVKEHKIK